MAFSTPAAGLVDLHSHLVPQIDDGTGSVAESLDSMAALARDGVTRLVTTPHLLIPRLTDDAAIARELDRQAAGFAQVRTAVAGTTGLPEIALGQEVLLPDAQSARRALRHSRIGLGGTAFWLVEFGFDLPDTHLAVIEALQQAGREVVVAHPERYHHRSLDQGLATLRAWYALGAWLQINAGSFDGHYRHSSPLSEELAWRTLESGLAHLVATDHHGARRAGVSPADAAQALVARGGTAQAERLLRENPDRVLRGLPPLPVTPLPVHSGPM